jgi:ferredoxin
MVTKRFVLTFPERIVTKPITYRLVKDFDLQFNILKAEITAEIEGKILIEIKGEKLKLEQGIDFLLKEGITIQDASRDIIVDRQQCINCGMCPSLCPTQALTMDSKKHELIFDKYKCILCGFCENSCPVNAIRLKI